MSDTNYKVNKVPAFPFRATVYKVDPGPGVDILVVNMNRHGVLCRFEESIFFTIGHSHRIAFEFPVLHKQIDNMAKVVKTYDALDVKKESPGIKVFMVEFHFQKLSLTDQKSIAEYLRLAGLESR